MKLDIRNRPHMRHRLLRYRYKSERPSLDYVMQHAAPGTTMFDVGANFGVYSYYMSKALGTSGQLFSFEPQPELGIHLDAVKETYRLDNLTIVRKGLSSAPGILKMRRAEPGSGGASFHYGPADNLEEIDVPVTTMDEFISTNKISNISFIKCDVEEHELEVFRGGEHTLSKFMPTLLFECHETEARAGDLFSYLTNLGYDGFFFYVSPSDHKSLLRNNKGKYLPYSQFGDYPYPRPSVQHRNYIFLKKGRHPARD